MKTTKSALVLSIIATSCALAACGSAPGEKATAGSAALSPNQDSSPTNYRVTLSSVHVVSAVELYDPPTNMHTSPGAWPEYTPDTGFVDWAEIGVKVNQNTPSTTGCVLVNGENTTDASTGETLSNCAPGGAANGPFNAGSPLSLPFTVTNPSDSVQLAIVMDNIEDTTAAVAEGGNNNPNSLLGNELSGAGAIVGAEGALVGAANPYAGVVFAAVGATISVIGNIVSSQASGGSYPNTCAGGLFSANNDAATSDTLVISLTPQQLSDMTANANGASTVTFNPSTTWSSNQGMGWGSCSSNLQLNLTVTRDWTSGTGPSPKSADSAVARTSTENDSFWANPALGAIERRYVDTQLENAAWGSGLKLAQADSPIAAVSANANDLAAFYTDGWGDINVAALNSTPPSILVDTGNPTTPYGHLTAAERFPGTYDVAWISTNGAVYDATWAAATPTSEYTATVHQVTAANTAPPGGGIAMVARSATSLDLVFVADDGTPTTSTSTNSGASWTTTAIAGATGVALAGGNITLASPISEALDAFYIGNSGALYQSSWTPRWGWTTSAVSAASIAPAGSSISSVSRGYAYLDVAFVGNGSTLYEASSSDSTSAWVDGGTWSVKQLPLDYFNWGNGALAANVGAYAGATSAGGSLSIVADTASNLDVYFHNPSGAGFVSDWAIASNTWTTVALPALPTSTTLPNCTFGARQISKNGGEYTLQCTPSPGDPAIAIYQVGGLVNGASNVLSQVYTYAASEDSSVVNFMAGTKGTSNTFFACSSFPSVCSGEVTLTLP